MCVGWWGWWCLFFLQTLKDLPEQFELQEGRDRRRAKDPQDVFVMVKEYISSTEMRRLPMLVLTPSHRATFTLTTDRYLFQGNHTVAASFLRIFGGVHGSVILVASF